MKQFSLYYGLAIQNNPESVEDMKNAIWAIYYHAISTDDQPQHHYCKEEWCKYLKSQNSNTDFKHKPALNPEILEYVQPVFESLTETDLLKRCLGGNTQNSNESFNNTIWSLAPKQHFSGKNVIELATAIATCIFNEGHRTLLKIMEIMGVQIGSQSFTYTTKRDSERIILMEKRTSKTSKEARIERKKARQEQEDAYEAMYGMLYGPGIDDE